MTEKPKPKSPKKKSGKTSPQGGVLASLPATRPTRLSRHEVGPGKAEGVAKPADPPSRASAHARAVEPAKQAGTSAASKTPAPRRRTPATTAAQAPGPKTTAKTRAATPAVVEAPVASEAPPAAEPARKPRGRPRPVRSGLPRHGTSERREPLPAPEPDEAGARETKLVTTAIQAAGELAQIGITLGGQLLKRTLDRLPKP